MDDTQTGAQAAPETAQVDVPVDTPPAGHVYQITSAQIGVLSSQADLGTTSIGNYDSGAGTLTIFDDALAAKAEAIMAVPGWDATATTEPLVTYANAKQSSLATGGFTLALAGQPVKIATDDQTRTAIMGKYLRMAQPGAPASIAWQVGPRSFVTISAADFAALAVKVADFVQATFDALAAVLAAIAAGTITTEAQIDAAAWPAATG